MTSYALYSVIGSPITQSLSPFLHTQSFRDYELNAVLMPFEIQPNQLATFCDALRLLKIQGCAVTLPHKSAILNHIDHLSEKAQQIGAANTLYWRGDRLCAENTDVDGFIDPLRNCYFNKENPVLILGAGGSARAIILGLKQLNCTSIFIASPSNHSAYQLAQEFNLTALNWQDRETLETQFIINTTPLGMLGKYQNETPYAKYKFHPQGGIAYDIVYQPKMTRFLTDAKANNWKIITGFEMFIGQANCQHQLWIKRDLTEHAKILTAQKLMQLESCK